MKRVNSNAIYKAIDKLLNYSLPLGVQKLTIDLEVDLPPLITVTYVPEVSETLETDINAHGVVVTREFNVVPITKKKKMSITIIGDVHGKWSKYYEIAKTKEYTIQLGDFGFSDTWNKFHYSGLDADKHKIIPGNHDDYDICLNHPACLGDYGHFEIDDTPFFFIRGGLSIDRVYRVGEELNGGPKTWWSQEELHFSQMNNCLKLYKKLKPEIVLSHVPPSVFIDKIHGNKDNSILQKFKFHNGFRENTSMLGTMMLDNHIPKLWISGHHHKSYQESFGDFKFVSLAELETYDL